MMRNTMPNGPEYSWWHVYFFLCADYCRELRQMQKIAWRAWNQSKQGDEMDFKCSQAKRAYQYHFTRNGFACRVWYPLVNIHRFKFPLSRTLTRWKFPQFLSVNPLFLCLQLINPLPDGCFLQPDYRGSYYFLYRISYVSIMIPYVLLKKFTLFHLFLIF